MTPLRIAGPEVEPLSLAQMRGYLRIDSDDTSEDALVTDLIAAARANVEAESRRVLAPAQFRLMLTAWPTDGVLPIPLSPLVSVTRAGTVGADGIVETIDLAHFSLGADPFEAPCLLIDKGVPLLLRRAALIEVAAGFGGSGPPVPGPLLQAIRQTVADWFENRGDDGHPRGLPEAAAALIAPYRLVRI